jgi:hypothetical protein
VRRSGYRKTSWLLALALSATVLALIEGSAHAATPTIKSWSFASARVTAGKHMTVKYSVVHVPATANIALQRQFGTGGVFKTVAKLPKGQSTKTLTAPVLGKYRYRIAIVRGGSVLKASKAKNLYSYGVLPLHTVLHRTSRTAQVGGTLYRYDWRFQFWTAVRTKVIRKQDSGSCRWIKFTAALTKNAGHAGTIQLLQEDADTQTETVPDNSVTSPVKWKLTGHAFKWTYHAVNYTTNTVGFLAGQASCWSTNWKTS